MLHQKTYEYQQPNEQAPVDKREQTRTENRAVGAYLEALEKNRPKRGRRPSKESIQKQLDDIKNRYESATPLQKIQLIQKRIDLEQKLQSVTETQSATNLEADFIAAVESYSQRKNISYQAWREIGVPAAVLKRGGIPYNKAG